MLKIVRLAKEEDWSYAPEDARLFSDEGPAFMPGPPRSFPGRGVASRLLFLCEGDGLRIKGGILKLGKLLGGSYNSFMDVSLAKGDGDGIALSGGDPVDGDVVVAVFPSDKMIVPARLFGKGNRLFLELPEKVGKDKRAFVVTEDGELVSMTFSTRDTETVGVIPRVSLASWLMAEIPEAMSSRFSVSANGDDLLIADKERGRTYLARRHGDPGEEEKVSLSLGLHGLPGIIANYLLRKV